MLATGLRVSTDRNHIILNDINRLVRCFSRLSYTILLIDVMKFIVNLNSRSNTWIDDSVLIYLKCSYFTDGKLNKSTYCMTWQK